MRLPSESQLSLEQKEVMNAPHEGTMLVIGPPGSGKTVVAVLRQRALEKKKAKVASVVFNNVLTRYTGNEHTFEKWVKAWWQNATDTPMPTAPTPGSNYRAPEYRQATELAVTSLKAAVRSAGHWGHLILDEAQDFHQDAHRLLAVVQRRVMFDLPTSGQPSICILADENQRISGSNSTIRQMREVHVGLEDDDVYCLKRNYRNTLQIARFAAHFYVGLQSGKPELPTREGDKPHVLRAKTEEAVKRIANYAKAHPDQEIGVLVQYTKTRDKYFRRLSGKLQGSGVRVQTYSSGHDASELKFDKPGTVTVLCFNSSKGLEFDAVFLPELQTLRMDGVELDLLRMSLYVMCSRARSQLWISIDDNEHRGHPVWGVLPGRDLWQEEN
jgi:superfamily I DNA/RNA helicase